MSLVKNLVGKKFGSLTVISLEKVRSKSGSTRWLCVCDCCETSTTIVSSSNLTSGQVKSCGKCLYNNWYNRYTIDENGCHICDVAKDKDGYGQQKLYGKQYKIHRLIYFKYNPNSDKKLKVCHTCDNPSCMNIKHLFLGTIQDNSNDMKNKNRQYKPKGSKNVNAKLKEADIIEIRKDNRSTKEIAQDYKVSGSTIRRIKLFQIWSHV